MHPETPEIRNHGNKPWASHFIVRKMGQIVPLIAVDELPPSLHIDGVPRYLSVVETKGMLNLGLQEEREGYYRVTRGEARTKSLVDSVHNPAKSQAGNLTAKEPATRPAETEVVTTTPRQPPPTPKSSSLSPSSREDREKPRSQQLCRHWCVHGVCKWGLGCHYRHRMPMDRDGLREVGLREWPGWFRRGNPGLFGDGGVRARRAGGVDVLERGERGERGLGEEILERLRRLEGREWGVEKMDGEGGGTEREKEKNGRKVKGRGAVKAPAVVEMSGKVERVERAKGLDDRIVRKETRRWEDDESGDDSDISSLPPRREVDISEGEAKRKEKLVDV
ncbi:hypothetical protein HYFRA_00009827 [Hymenoscyphus fraxineus]|uniref:C3H1-type domain-containing protein n=1 Tax=Hymenoscyphus fraxineus TaxID=746836 RepID=A0A9N9L7P6_9HELO|nr:hypothetical protein HYFRA_00009827 [Hymenoscyphus fraxineus]